MEFKAKAPDGRVNIVGHRLKEYRLLKKMSLRDMAAKLQTGGLDWDHTQLYRAEQGEKAVNDVEVVLLSTILKIPYKKLLEISEDPEQTQQEIDSACF